MASSSTCPTRGGSTAPRHSERTVQLVLTIDRAIYRFARHWLGFLNSLLWGWVALIFLAPVLAAAGYQAASRPIYAYNGLFCHQRPDRSFYVLGEKMACCQRCAAIYSSMALLGLLYVALRGRVRAPSWRTLGLLAAPVAIDGLTQLLGLRESTAALRVATGALFGLALCWLLFPYLEIGFAEMRDQLERRFARLAAEGRAQPL